MAIYAIIINYALQSKFDFLVARKHCDICVCEALKGGQGHYSLCSSARHIASHAQGYLTIGSSLD